MTEHQPLAAAYPAPPFFYRQFTAQHVARLKEFQCEFATSEDSALEQEPKLDIPADLQCLIPPEPPTDGKFRCFGGALEVNEQLTSLKDQGLIQLYPSPPSGETIGSEWTLDRASYLKKFAKSILLNYLELIGILAMNPTQFGDKIEHLIRLFYNSHTLINEYRPHQARETLIMMMEEQLAGKEAEVEGINRMREKVEEVIAGLGTDNGDAAAAMLQDEEDAKELRKEAKETERQLWQAMDEDLL